MEEVYTVKVRAQPDAARLYPSERRYSASTVGGLGAMHLALAAICVLLAALDMAQPPDFLTTASWTARYGGGAWLGTAAALAGLTGILAWRRWYIDNNIRWFFICSCVAGVTALLCLAVTSAALAVTREEWSSTRMRILRELHNPPEMYKMDQNVKQDEVQRLQRHAEIISNDKDFKPQIYSPNDGEIMDSSHVIPSVQHIPHSSEPQNIHLKVNDETIVPADEAITSQTYKSNVPMLPENPTQNIYLDQGISQDHAIDISPHTTHNHDEESDGITQISEVVGQMEQDSTNIHHITLRQALAEDQSHVHVDETNSPSEDDHVLKEEAVADHLSMVSDTAETNKLDNHEDSGIKDEQTNVNYTEQTMIRSVIPHHWLPNRGRETRFVISINLLVACVLEIAWSILSAKIAWKGMKNGYPEDGPPRTDSSRTGQQGEQKDKSKSRNKKSNSLRKPDIISNHDKGKCEIRRKTFKEERKDPSLPSQESTMEYQERVRRFLASNNVTNIEAGVE